MKTNEPVRYSLLYLKLSVVLLLHQTVHQAQCLANQVQLFYGTQRHETYQLVETFNHRPADFKHMSVIAELEQSGLGAEVASTGS